MLTETVRDTVLESEWHPVYIAKDLKEAPVSVIVLGERVAVFRAASGSVHALRDLCVHRGAMLSKGRVEGETLVCPYHGWKYDGAGACVCIPAQAKTDKIPPRARATKYHAVEKYGLVWVCIGEPKSDLPYFEEFENADYRPLPCGPYTVHAAWYTGN